jgi:DNA-binding HxlR family transcriptional regulator
VSDDRLAGMADHPRQDSVTRALELVGERWTLLILREAFFGVRRYAQFARNLEIARPTLSTRLSKLVDAGLLTRVRYAGGPMRDDYEYRLTQAGLDLFPSVLALMSWGDKYLPADGQPAQTFVHHPCQQPTKPQLTCDVCGEVITVHDVHSIGHAR